MYHPTLKEARALTAGGEYRRVPVSRELLSDFITPIQALRILRAKSGHCFLLESAAVLDPDCPLFRGCSSPTPVARYHSLAADPATLPDCLRVTARTEEGEIMAVQHRTHPIFGVQFHPESILTPEGKTMLENFIHL